MSVQQKFKYTHLGIFAHYLEPTHKQDRPSSRYRQHTQYRLVFYRDRGVYGIAILSPVYVIAA
jgi:hypothetical protein